MRWLLVLAACSSSSAPLPKTGAYETGGIPASDQAIENVLIGDLTQLVVDSEQDRKTVGIDLDREQRLLELRNPAPMITRGAPLAHAWKGLIATLERWIFVPQAKGAVKAYASELRARAHEVSEQLAALGIGYYLEGDVYGSHASVQSYRVEEVAFVGAGDEKRRVLSLRRLDKLNLEHNLLGMESADLGDPVLLLDQIDEHVASRVLPLLDPLPRYPLPDDRVAYLAGAAVRRELMRALGDDAKDAPVLGAVINARQRLFATWAVRGMEVPRLETVFSDAHERLPVGFIDKVRARQLEDALVELDAGRIAVHLHHVVTATVRRHEAQHGLDEDRGRELPVPAVFSQLSRKVAERARNELSAYLSQIASDPATPQLSLWGIARYALMPELSKLPEAYAGRALLAAMGGPEKCAAMSDDQLRAAAARAWEGFFEEPFVLITDR